MYRILVCSLLLFFPSCVVNSQTVSGLTRVETEEQIDVPPDEILLGKRKAYWKVFGKRLPSNLRYLTDVDVIIIISLCLLMVLIFTGFISSKVAKDSWHNGYDEGVYSKITDLAKIRHMSVDDVCIATVPEEIWNQLHDEYTARSWYARKLRKIKKWLSEKLGDDTPSDGQ